MADVSFVRAVCRPAEVHLLATSKGRLFKSIGPEIIIGSAMDIARRDRAISDGHGVARLAARVSSFTFEFDKKLLTRLQSSITFGDRKEVLTDGEETSCKEDGQERQEESRQEVEEALAG